MHKQKHRGIHPKDEILFGRELRDKLGQAVLDLYFLYSRNYSESAALRIVGDHFLLQKRQRFALQRMVSCKDEIQILNNSEVDDEFIKGRHLAIDGFNLLIFAEVLLSDGFVFQCLDETYRDIASVHGSYHQIVETGKAIHLLGQLLETLQPKSISWFLDQPVSNSGKLGKFMREISDNQNWKWKVEIVPNPDQAMLELKQAVLISNDRIVLSRSNKWFNLSKLLVKRLGKNNTHLLELRDLGVTKKSLTSINALS
ncbi:MAG: DUF434 domain-containing protein [Saprospiraceae bacterium]|nr:DUF434 domain-containing protein [Saprospiraceae bacterium]